MKLFFKNHLPLVFFSIFVVLSLVAILCFQVIALKDMKQRNNRILAHYEEILSIKSDSIEQTCIDLGLYSKAFKFTPAQILAFQDYTNRIIENAVAQSRVDMEVNAIVKAKAESMYQETKDLLEIEFAKIQHETESLQIWCGILTVVFLIFSFYSLFKTDELVQQGRDGVKELSFLQESGKKDIEEMKRTGLDKIHSFELASSEAIARAGRRAVIEKQKIEDAVNERKEIAVSIVNKKVDEANRMLDKKYEDLSSALEEKIRSLSMSDNMKDNELLKSVLSRLEVLVLRIDEIERLNSVHNG